MNRNYYYLAHESEILLYAAILGLEIVIVYDFFRSIRRALHTGYVWNASMDILFWLYTGRQTFYIMHTYSNGNFRWFAILGVCVVVFVYLRFISRYVVTSLSFMIRKMSSLIIFIGNGLTGKIKKFIIRLRRNIKRRKQHGKKNCVSDEIS